MPTQKFLKNAYEYFQTLNQVFYFVIAVPLVLFCLTYLQWMERGGLSDQVRFTWFHALIVLATAAFLWLAYYLYRKKIRDVAPSEAFQQKLYRFHRSAWTKYLLLAAGNLVPIVGLYLTGEQLFVGLYAIALVIFSVNRPTLRRVIDDLCLNDDEKKRLTDEQDFAA